MSFVMHIVSASDERYIPGLFVTWGTLLISSPETDFDFHLLHDGIQQTQLDDLKVRLRRISPNFSLNIYALDPDLFKDFPGFFFDSKMPYARLLISELLNVKIALYIDTDLLFLRNVDEISQFNLGSCMLGVVEEWGYNGEDDSKIFFKEFPKVLNHRYFNSGLLLMDLERIRKEKILEKALLILHQYPERCKWHDQTALNVAFAGKCAYLDSHMNYQLKPGRDLSIQEIPLIAQRKINLHYVTGTKPWIRPNHSLSHRLYKFMEGNLLDDPTIVKKSMEKVPVLASSFVHQLKAFRLRLSAPLKKSTLKSQLKLALAHEEISKKLWHEAIENKAIQQCFLTLLNMYQS